MWRGEVLTLNLMLLRKRCNDLGAWGWTAGQGIIARRPYDHPRPAKAVRRTYNRPRASTSVRRPTHLVAHELRSQDALHQVHQGVHPDCRSMYSNLRCYERHADPQLPTATVPQPPMRWNADQPTLLPMSCGPKTPCIRCRRECIPLPRTTPYCSLPPTVAGVSTRASFFTKYAQLALRGDRGEMPRGEERESGV
jgi:hypothetical protein